MLISVTYNMSANCFVYAGTKGLGIFNINKNKIEIDAFKHNLYTSSIAFSKNEKFLACGISDGKIIIYNFITKSKF